MAEDFQAGICGGSWWNPVRSHVFMGCSSPCSVMNSGSDDVGTYGSWVTAMAMAKEANNSVSDDSSVVFQSSKTPQQSSTTDSDNSGGSVLIDSSLQMMGFGVSSPLSSSDWNQNILRGREESYNFMLQEDMNSSLNSSQQHKQDFSLDQQQQGLNHVSSAAAAGNSIATTCQGFSSGSYGGYNLHGLFEPNHQTDQSLFNNRSISGYGNSLSELSHNWPKLSPLLKPSLPKHHQQQQNSLHFSNNTPFWNASVNSFLSSPQPQILLPSFEEKPICSNISSKGNNNSEEVVKKASSEPAMKRARIETPSPLPTFKVRKEKLGDRITALQQLVSPFGKTDTASVLHEAIEYIKFLHDQVNALSTPYMKNNNAIQPQQCGDTLKEAEGAKQDLRSLGLCLVPISSTFPVANETTADFWTPTFGGTFR